MTALGARMGWNDSADDQFNRELFEEQLELIKKAWYNESFAHQGRFYSLPAPGHVGSAASARGALQVRTAAPRAAIAAT